MATPTQNPGTMLIGIGSYTYTGYIVESVDLEKTGQYEEVKDEADDTAHIIVSNKGKRLRLSMLVKAATTPETIKKGAQITVNSVIYLVEDAKVSRNRKVAKFDLTLYRPDSLTLT
jgi:hypothetical protein